MELKYVKKRDRVTKSTKTSAPASAPAVNSGTSTLSLRPKSEFEGEEHSSRGLQPKNMVSLPHQVSENCSSASTGLAYIANFAQIEGSNGKGEGPEAGGVAEIKQNDPGRKSYEFGYTQDSTGSRLEQKFVIQRDKCDFPQGTKVNSKPTPSPLPLNRKNFLASRTILQISVLPNIKERLE